jgi:hypothetical protein
MGISWKLATKNGPGGVSGETRIKIIIYELDSKKSLCSMSGLTQF